MKIFSNILECLFFGIFRAETWDLKIIFVEIPFNWQKLVKGVSIILPDFVGHMFVQL